MIDALIPALRPVYMLARQMQVLMAREVDMTVSVGKVPSLYHVFVHRSLHLPMDAEI